MDDLRGTIFAPPEGMRHHSSRTVQRAYTFAVIALLWAGVAGAQQPKKGHVTAQRAQAEEPNSQMIAVQVALDRAGFSPGEIDGQGGAKTRLAIAAFQTANNLQSSGAPDEPTLAALHVAPEPITSYTISQQDVAGPFLGSMPKDLMAEAKLPALNYTNAIEEVAEKFHSSQTLLRRL